jgi:hypothetical protein
VAGLSEAALSHRPAEGDWSIRENVGHLRDHAEFLHQRLSMISKLEEPRLEPYDEQALIRERDPQGADFGALLDEFSALRAQTVELLAGLVHWNWARTGRHAELGRISTRQLVDRALAHDEDHLRQICELKAAAPRNL